MPSSPRVLSVLAPPVAPARRRPLDALVVLGCRVGAAGELEGPALRRVEQTASAYAEGTAPLILVSGGRRWGAVAEAEAMRRGLVARGVPGEHVVVELLSLTTLENARYASVRLERRGITQIGLVTCDWHMPRASRHFTDLGFDVVGIPAISPPSGALRSLYRQVRETVATWIDRAH
jgi:uncharacterized SAM-binding protein YcdF (DUF218 family)